MAVIILLRSIRLIPLNIKMILRHFIVIKDEAMKILQKFSKHFKIRSLQNRFDEQLQQVQDLMQQGRVDESGKALLEAERLRKEIEEMEELEAPRLDEEARPPKE